MFLAIVTVVYVLTGCKNPTKDFEALADQACACADGDAACGTKVMADVMKLAETSKASDGDQKRILEAGRKMNDCLLSTGVGPKAVTEALAKLDK